MTKILSVFFALLTFITGFYSNRNFTVNYYTYTDIYYGEDERHCFDIALPGDYEGDLDLVLYIHGGSWIHGSKDSWLPFIKNMTKNHGYAAAAISYRYADADTDCFDILDDIDAALAEIKDMCLKKGINIKNVALYGSSAGSHLCLMYAYTRKDTAPVTPAAAIVACAPTDLTKDSLYYNSVLGTPKRIASLISDVCGYQFTIDMKDTPDVQRALLKASPISYVDENSVPTLIAHGMLDEAIDFSNAVQLDEKLTEFGVEHDLIIFPTSGHALENDPDQKRRRSVMTYEYLQKYLPNCAISDQALPASYTPIF